jgi:hypothetical protein
MLPVAVEAKDTLYGAVFDRAVTINCPLYAAGCTPEMITLSLTATMGARFNCTVAVVPLPEVATVVVFTTAGIAAINPP